MDEHVLKNARRFTGFAGLYDGVRPRMPVYPVEVIRQYLGRKPDRVVDLGCGTGLSTLVWRNRCLEVIGIEPSDDMLAVAQKKEINGIAFRKGSSTSTGLPDKSADAVICSQSFHWMEPRSALSEINRVLRPGGVFATVDCDWPPVSDWRVEKKYKELFDKVLQIEKTEKLVESSFVRWEKTGHLHHIESSGYFRYVREIVFSSREKCDAERLIGLAKSQGGLQSILKVDPGLIEEDLARFMRSVRDVFGETVFDIDFGYRMRIGVK
ncbi:class I SAM-dependent methyltransferase [Oxalobacter aliiformigenes]|uniref:Class I SAM-dependent methyltransferase n=1 Tax=Oxalobacter aliiformigenes TaxID=2946593 RepID=A0ABY7JH60_9BURK|nr:class I SAM-dependent methyltransferase [Oxalobacter aliiformigenes]WAV92938.1 class I SAM-dependent methyltransferase [Oxalobacter aliiformigenes]WAV95559.1 class I SAM-dependent methyltransferase [Oxalobacter aliiformigenes]WAV96647.1 class I SAM-dependent methyltransferase [Oxalobacter aliiformigenes]